MLNARWSHPRRSVVALIAILLAVFAAVPSATAHDEHAKDHARHIQHFLALSTDVSDESLVLIANGPIHAQGTDNPVDDNTDEFVFPDGSLTIKHQTAMPGKDSFDPVTCLAKYTERGTFEVTAGTGAYADAHGHGHYKVKVLAVGCDQNKEPDVFSFKITASGPLHL
jgi:hypothetical protein